MARRSATIVLALMALLIAATASATATAGVREGKDHMEAGRFDAALAELLPAAQSGNAEAEELVGVMYAMGLGVPRDDRRAFEDVTGPDDIRIIHIANALAEFITVEFRADGSAYDAYLAGDESALSEDARRGLALFGGKAGCAGCHTGPLQTDQDFHAIAMPQIGYARSRVWDPVIRDRGRVNETDRATDVYKFRTPSLRNVAHTAPYGHAGAYRTLEAVIRHHLDPLAGLDGYDPAQAVLPPHPTLSAKDHHVLENAWEQAGIRAANSLDRLA